MAALRFFFYLLMKPAALGFAFLGLTGILAPYVDPNVWWVPAFSGLFMPVILIFNFFLLIFWGIHRKCWVLLPLLSLIGNYRFFNVSFQWPWKEIPIVSDTTPALTIGSYNVEGFYWIAQKEEQQPIIKLVKQYQIDILCFQEHCEESNIDTALLKQRIGLPYRQVYFNRHTDWANFGISIYSRYPIIRGGKIDFDSEQNAGMWVDVKINQDTIRIFNNHLQTTNVNLNREQYKKYRSVKNWRGQARTLVTLLEQLKQNFQIRATQARQVREMIDTTRYPLIVCGDFNDTPISYVFNHVKGKNLKDGFEDCGKGYGHTFNGIKSLLRIDYITYNVYWTGISYEAPHLKWSDHNPIIMKLKLEKKLSSPPPLN